MNADRGMQQGLQKTAKLSGLNPNEVSIVDKPAVEKAIILLRKSLTSKEAPGVFTRLTEPTGEALMRAVKRLKEDPAWEGLREGSRLALTEAYQGSRDAVAAAKRLDGVLKGSWQEGESQPTEEELLCDLNYCMDLVLGCKRSFDWTAKYLEDGGKDFASRMGSHIVEAMRVVVESMMAVLDKFPQDALEASSNHNTPVEGEMITKTFISKEGEPTLADILSAIAALTEKIRLIESHTGTIEDKEAASSAGDSPQAASSAGLEEPSAQSSPEDSTAGETVAVDETLLEELLSWVPRMNPEDQAKALAFLEPIGAALASTL